MTTTATFQVHGMTCGHCVSAVRAEVSAIDAVASVDVDLATGLLTVTSAAPIAANAIRAAVEEAGYKLVL